MYIWKKWMHDLWRHILKPEKERSCLLASEMFNNVPPPTSLNTSNSASNDKITNANQSKEERIKRILELKSKSDKISKSLKIKGEKEAKKQNLILKNGEYIVTTNLTVFIIIRATKSFLKYFNYFSWAWTKKMKRYLWIWFL